MRNKHLIATATALLGTLVLVFFGPHSIGAMLKLFQDFEQPVHSETPVLQWAALGGFLFLIGEASEMFMSGRHYDRKMNRFLLGGRILQMIGLMGAMFSLWCGMIQIRRLSSAVYAVVPEMVASTLAFWRLILFICLLIVFLGQCIQAIGKFCYRAKGLSDSEPVASGHLVLKYFSRIARMSILGLFALLFLYTSLFNFELASSLEETNPDPANIANSLQGMMIYPFLAYFLLIVFCVLSMITDRSTQPVEMAPADTPVLNDD